MSRVKLTECYLWKIRFIFILNIRVNRLRVNFFTNQEYYLNDKALLRELVLEFSLQLSIRFPILNLTITKNDSCHI